MKPIFGADSGASQPPRLVIVTLSMDNPQDLSLTLGSLRKQKDAPARHVIVDSSADDACRELAQGAEAEYVWLPPSGIYPAMRFGLAMLDENDYCLFLNSGDYLYSDETITSICDSLRADGGSPPVWAVGGVELVGEASRRLQNIPEWRNKEQRKLMWGRLWFPHPSTVALVEALRSVSAFESSLRIAEDYHTSLKLLKKYGPPVQVTKVWTTHFLDGISNTQVVRSGSEASLARLKVYGYGGIPREVVNVCRLMVGRMLKSVVRKLIH